MDARTVDEARTRLVQLRHDEIAQFALAFVTMGVALALTALHSPLVLPLFLGGVAVWALGIRTLWRRWDLLDHLADDPAAHVISDVGAYAARRRNPGEHDPPHAHDERG